MTRVRRTHGEVALAASKWWAERLRSKLTDQAPSDGHREPWAIQHHSTIDEAQISRFQDALQWRIMQGMELGGRKLIKVQTHPDPVALVQDALEAAGFSDAQRLFSESILMHISVDPPGNIEVSLNHSPTFQTLPIG